MPLDYNQSAVRYAAKTKLMELALEIAETRNLRKVSEEINKGFQIFLRLQALDYGDYLSKDERDQICYCLMELADLTDLPVAPVLGSVDPPSILVGIRGAQGEQGEDGAEGGGVPFSYENITQDTVVDSFAITESRGVEYTLNIYSGDDHMRTMRIQGAWTSDGSTYGDDGGIGQTIVGDVSDVSMSIVVSGTTVQLLATVIPGETWTIEGTRKYIPNNGNGIVSPTSLTDGKIWIGNGSNQPVANTISGDITISNAGVAAIGSQVIVNADISSSAAINYSKMEALTASRAVVTNGSGVPTTSAVTATQIGYLSTVTSDIQVQLDSKLSAATGAISTVVSSNLTPSFAVISNPSGKIAVSSVSTIELGYVQGVTSGIQAQLNAKLNLSGGTLTGALASNSSITTSSTGEFQGGVRTASSGDFLKKTIINIGDWNMDSTSNVAVNHGLTLSKIRGIEVIIRNDADNAYYLLNGYTDGSNTIDGWISQINSTQVSLSRRPIGLFDSTDFDSTSFNRGFITITHTA